MRSIEEQISEIRRRSSLYREKKELRLLSLAATGVGALLLMVMILAPGVKGTMGFGVSHLGATILEPEAGGYVIVALLSFTLGVIITLITQKYRKTGKALKKTAPLFFITFLSSLFLISGSAYAGEETVYNITEGSITVSADSADGSRHKIKQGENEEETVEGILVIAGNETKTKNTILVNAGEGQKADIVIRGVSIDVSKDYKASLLTEGAGDVDIELDGKNTLIAGSNYAGLQKENTGTLIIKDENWKEGSLETIGGKLGAGIGGGNGGSGENITITGGTVTATAGSRGAGIGGGETASGNNIMITGGTVTATGGSHGAGIGGGQTASGNNIMITGGTVTATGGSSGAGIGGGYKGAGNNITITGGTVISKGVNGGAGIGGGQTASGNNITISGGYVTATGGADITVSENALIVSNRGTAIGNGYEEVSEDNNIVISGWARVTASCYNKTKIKTINCYNPSKYDFSVLYNTGSITTYSLSPTIDGSIQGRNPISQRDGQGTPSATKVHFRSVPEGVVSNFPSDSDDLYKAGSTISMNALEYDSKKYRLLGLSISSGTGILTGDQTDGYELVVGEKEEGRDSIVVTARFATLSSSADPVKENTPEAVFTAAGEDNGTLSGLINGESYVLTGAATSTFTASGTSRNITGVSPGTLSIVRKGDGSRTTDSDPQEISISRAETPTGINKTDCISASGNDGKITGVTEAMEYRKSDASTWMQVTGSEILELTPGTYYIRIKAADTTLASETVALVIKAYAAPGQVQAPLFDPPAGSYEGEQNISITCETPDAVIYYTVDGSDPATDSTKYSKPVSVTENMTIKAFAVKDGMNNSAVSTAVYTIGEEPVITKYFVTVNNGTGGGKYEAGETVTIKTDDPPEGKVFDKWTSEDGVEFSDEVSTQTTFTMPARNVTVSATYKDKGKKEDEPDPNPDPAPNPSPEKPVPEKIPEKVPVSDPASAYASPEDNFAPVAPGSSEGTGGSIKKLELDFSKVNGSGVAPDNLKMTAIAGSKFTTRAKVKDKNSVHTEGGVKAKFNKKDGTATITCKKDGNATFETEEGTFKVEFKVDKPKPNKNEAKISTGTAPVTKTVKDLFGTSISGGKLTIVKEKLSGQATLKGNELTINPAEKDTIKVQYQYLNKKYKLSIKVK